MRARAAAIDVGLVAVSVVVGLCLSSPPPFWIPHPGVVGVRLVCALIVGAVLGGWADQLIARLRAQVNERDRHAAEMAAYRARVRHEAEVRELVHDAEIQFRRRVDESDEL